MSKCSFEKDRGVFKGGLSVSVFVINWVSLGGTWFEGTKIMDCL